MGTRSLLYSISVVGPQDVLPPPMVLVPPGALEEPPSPSLDVSVSIPPPPPPLLAVTAEGLTNRTSPDAKSFGRCILAESNEG